ncbi:MAG TPA: hypothetical protein VFR07_11440 [Mycobacteriales bacterium]|nr:hypothetical protein [Mycobacteriales bacterium]
MTLMLPFVLLGPLLMLLSAVLALAAHGPLGWLAAALLVVGVAWATRWLARITWAWWVSTKAPRRE